MLKVKIKDFKINTGDKEEIKATLPCSLSTALSAARGELPLRVDFDTNTVEFTGVVEIEPHILSMKHICLRLSGISEPAEVILNGKVVSTPDSRERIYIYNVKDRLVPGYNAITVRFVRDSKTMSSSGIRLRRGESFDPAIESATLLAFNSAAISSVNVTQTHADGAVTLNVNMGIIGDKTDAERNRAASRDKTRGLEPRHTEAVALVVELTLKLGLRDLARRLVGNTDG